MNNYLLKNESIIDSVRIDIEEFYSRKEKFLTANYVVNPQEFALGVKQTRTGKYQIALPNFSYGVEGFGGNNFRPKVTDLFDYFVSLGGTPDFNFARNVLKLGEQEVRVFSDKKTVTIVNRPYFFPYAINNSSLSIYKELDVLSINFEAGNCNTLQIFSNKSISLISPTLEVSFFPDEQSFSLIAEFDVAPFRNNTIEIPQGVFETSSSSPRPIDSNFARKTNLPIVSQIENPLCLFVFSNSKRFEKVNREKSFKLSSINSSSPDTLNSFSLFPPNTLNTKEAFFNLRYSGQATNDQIKITVNDNPFIIQNNKVYQMCNYTKFIEPSGTVVYQFSLLLNNMSPVLFEFETPNPLILYPESVIRLTS